MTGAGIALGAPWGLLGLVGGAAIVWIHRYRRRYRRVETTALFLWGQPSVVASAGRRRRRLIRSRSLWAELLCVLALTWWLVDPHLAGAERAKHWVFVLDSRVSLQAVGADGATPHQRLKGALRRQLADLDGDDRVTLVATGAPAMVLAGPEATPGEALAALADGGPWRADAGAHDVSGALALAADLGSVEAGVRDGSSDGDGAGADDGGQDGAGRRVPGRVVWVSDRMPELAAPLPEAVGLLLRGESAAQVGISDVRWGYADARGPERVAIRITASGDTGHDLRRTLRWHASTADGGGLIREEAITFTIEGGAATSIQRILPVPPSTTDGIAISLSVAPAITHTAADAGAGAGIPARDDTARRPDPTPWDDAAFALRRPPRPLTIVVAETLAPQRRAMEGLIRVMELDPESTQRAPKVSASTALWVGSADAAPPIKGGPALWRLDFDAGEADPVIGPFLSVRGDPVLAGLDWTGAVWSGGLAYDALPDSARPLLMAGDAVLMAELSGGDRVGGDHHRGARHLILYLDAARSTITEHPAWPALIANLLAARRGAMAGASRTNVHVGAPFQVVPPAGIARVLVSDGRGGQELLRGGGGGGAMIHPGLASPGVYGLSAQGRPLDGGPNDADTKDADTKDADTKDAGTNDTDTNDTGKTPRFASVSALLIDPRLSDLTPSVTRDRAPRPPTLGRVSAAVGRRRGPIALLLPLLIATLAAAAAWALYRQEASGASPQRPS